MSSVTNAPPSGQSPAAAAQVAVVGAGLIGRAWALVFARGGVPVRAFDPQPRARAAVRAWIDETLADLAEFGLIDEPVQAIAARVTVCDRLEDALRDADYVQENIVEQLEPKQALFATLAQHTGERTVLASSSSYIPISAMTRGLPQADRCLIAHPVNPPHLVPLVEICPSKSTAGWAIDAAFALHAAVGQVPIRVKRELEGFILN
ncbi:MAG TPA: 3-hydroxyacyl-CoA dehydrogenase NAD-binding domain-containing protein, partial [Burkholderiaceae bacterium]|nr:3-hydroxyacyl-CoA dehydrogenase NAD-binding domain-containing protein [Burkholderiaceae bacterium]